MHPSETKSVLFVAIFVFSGVLFTIRTVYNRWMNASSDVIIKQT